MVVKAILGVGLAVFAIILLVRWSDVKDAVERWLAHIQKGSLPEALGGYWLIYVTTLLLLLPVEMLVRRFDGLHSEFLRRVPFQSCSRDQSYCRSDSGSHIELFRPGDGRVDVLLVVSVRVSELCH